MAATVYFHRLATREFQAARQWYRQRNLQTELSFRSEVDKAVQQIAGTPDRWPVYQGAYRWIRGRRFPYLLYYRVRDPYQVIILAVAHARRRPGYWKRRR